MKVKLQMLMLSIDNANNRILALSDNKESLEIPSYELNEEDNLEDCIKSLFRDYSDLSFRYIKIELTQVTKVEDTLQIMYHTLYPHDCPVKKGYGYTLDDESDEGLNKILNRIINSL